MLGLNKLVRKMEGTKFLEFWICNWVTGKYRSIIMQENTQHFGHAEGYSNLGFYPSVSRTTL